MKRTQCATDTASDTSIEEARYRYEMEPGGLDTSWMDLRFGYQLNS